MQNLQYFAYQRGHLLIHPLLRTCSKISKHKAGFPHGHGVPGEEQLHQLGVFNAFVLAVEDQREEMVWLEHLEGKGRTVY